MNFSLGRSSLQKLSSDQASAENAAPVSTVAGGTEVCTVDMGTVEAGDWLLCHASVAHLKGLAAGFTFAIVGKSAGTATIEALNDQTTIAAGPDSQGATGLRYQISLFGIIRVTVGGTLTLRLEVSSGGSDGTIDAGDGQLAVYRFVA